MAAPYSDTTALSNLVQTAYDQSVRLALRSTPLFRSVADTKVINQTQPGNTIVFNIHQDLAPATTPLNEVNDPTGVSLNNTTEVTVTLNEYGNFTVVTNALKNFNLDQALDANVANTIAYNLADSIDQVVANVLNAGTNVIIEDGTTDAITTDPETVVANTISAKDIRFAVAKLRGANVPTVDGQNYVAFIHPDVATDFRTETGESTWSAPHEYVDTKEIYAGEIGTYNGVRFIETSRAPKVDGVYSTFVLGKEALAEAVAQEFGVVVDGRIVDPLDRKMAIGWYGIAGWSLFRPEALWVIKTVSSLDI